MHVKKNEIIGGLLGMVRAWLSGNSSNPAKACLNAQQRELIGEEHFENIYLSDSSSDSEIWWCHENNHGEKTVRHIGNWFRRHLDQWTGRLTFFHQMSYILESIIQLAMQTNGHTYCKPANTKQYFKSCHRWQTTTQVPYRLARRKCTNRIRGISTK